MNALRRLTTRKESFVTTLSKLFEFSTLAYSKNPLSRYVEDDSQTYTYGSFRAKCLEISHNLSRYGIKAGDRIAILSQNMPNWTVAFFSAVAFGRVAVPILPDSSESEVTNILTHSGTKVLFVSERMIGKVSQEMMDKMVLVFNLDKLQIVKRDDKAFTCEGWLKEPQPDDLAAIIYTSGTSGKAKGVMLSHRNLSHNVIAAYHAQKTKAKDRWLSILPMPHTYEMAFSVLYPLYVGACVHYLQKPPTPTVLIAAMKSVKPTIMCSVPLIIEKVYKASIVPTINKSRILSWMKDHLPSLLYFFVGRKLYATFGGHLRFFGIGGSKLDPTVEEFLLKARFPYAIGYGLTETAPLITNACVGKTKVGSIGVPAYGVEVKLQNVNPQTGEGEIVAKGDNVMLGYYKDPERTRGVVTDDGWFRTNDLAVMDEKGYYYIKGRLNNMILGASGENIYPEEIEQVINTVEGVNESLVMERDGKLVALVKFDDNVINWNQAGEDKFFENLAEKKKAIMDYVNKRVSKQSKVNDVEVMKDPFEKTATHKIRRFRYKNAKGDDVKHMERLNGKDNDSKN
ncbi:MAG: AMP-binding protein [Candidatus Cryptobacteroides sp.]|nr:AMP-binding protein [Bacteroidales bacterium]MDD6052347.1 AMP-binding protein [Bacteroidales bacterium]